MYLSEEDLRLENEKLDSVINEIDEQIKNKNIKIKDNIEDLKEFQKISWENMREMDAGEKKAFINENNNRIDALSKEEKNEKNLIRARKNPYFGSIVLNNEPLYIGITSIKKDLDYYVLDWRAPISSIFYDFEIGDVSYETPGGMENGTVTRKRQYKIEDSKLKHIFDTNLNIDDDLLQDVLAQTSSDKMKNIVNTIQKEQNNVIRDSRTKNIIVQGIAGSGKTSVALHRIAYLLYKIDNLRSSNVLIFSPNKVFTEYISDVLPGLGEENTLETTYNEFVCKMTEEYETVESYSSFVERYYKGVRQDNDLIEFKLSDKMINIVEDYCKYITMAARFINDLEYKKKTIPMDELNELLSQRYDNKPLFERIDLIAEKINNIYYKGYASDYNSIKNKLLKITNVNAGFKELYFMLYNSVVFKDKYKIPYRENENKRNIKEKVLKYEDASLFMYMKFLLTGFPYQVEVKQVIVDEAQDYTYLQYIILQKIFKNANFTILGDIHQTVNPFYHYETLKVLLKLFNKDSKYIELNKSYRSSPEIIEYANKVLDLNHVSSIRRTKNLPVIKKELSDLKHIGRDIKYLKQKYKSVAIITKSIDEARIIADGLKTIYKEVCVIDITSSHFDKNLIVAPAYGVKGLEFDSAIIVNNFSDDKYLYYVAVTRAQHELIVYE